tara:strand:+ start:347 stop:544 length:198 start_codon:yes stop_codon:yes gene_type:complete
MTRDQLTIANHLIEALQVIARDNHDIEDADDSDRPSQKPNWAMRASQFLEEAQAEFYEGARDDRR